MASSVYTLSAQSKYEIDSLLSLISEIKNSKIIVESAAAKKLMSYRNKILPLLASNFGDGNVTKVRSDCQDTFLTKGEIAIIIADRIELMPYATLTGIQNCLLQFCEDNPNLVEFYIDAIRRNSVQIFEQKYSAWLASNDRKKWPFYRINKKKKIKFNNDIFSY